MNAALQYCDGSRWSCPANRAMSLCTGLGTSSSRPSSSPSFSHEASHTVRATLKLTTCLFTWIRAGDGRLGNCASLADRPSTIHSSASMRPSCWTVCCCQTSLAGCTNSGEAIVDRERTDLSNTSVLQLHLPKRGACSGCLVILTCEPYKSKCHKRCIRCSGAAFGRAAAEMDSDSTPCSARRRPRKNKTFVRCCENHVYDGPFLDPACRTCEVLCAGPADGGCGQWKKACCFHAARASNKLTVGAWRYHCRDCEAKQGGSQGTFFGPPHKKDADSHRSLCHSICHWGHACSCGGSSGGRCTDMGCGQAGSHRMPCSFAPASRLRWDDAAQVPLPALRSSPLEHWMHPAWCCCMRCALQFGMQPRP